MFKRNSLSIQLTSLLIITGSVMAVDGLSKNPQLLDSLTIWLSETNATSPQSPRSVELLFPVLVRNSNSIQAAVAGYEAARSSESKISNFPDPSLSVGIFGEPLETANGPQRFKIGLNQSIPLPGKIRAEKAIFRTRTAQALSELELTFLQEIHTLRQIWNDLVTQSHLRTILKQKMGLSEELLSVMDTGYRSGLVSHAGLTRQQIDHRLLEDTQARITDATDRAMIRMMTLLQLETPLVIDNVGDIGLPDLIEIDSKTQNIHPRVNRLSALVAESSASIDRAQAAFYPDFRLGLEIMILDEKEAGGVILPGSGQDAWVVSVGAELPLWNWKQKRAGLRATELQHRQSTLLLEHEQLAEQESILLTQSRLQQHLRRIDLFQSEIIPRGAEQVRIAEQNYITDDGDLSAYIQAKQVLLDMKIELIEEQKRAADEWVNISFWRSF